MLFHKLKYLQFTLTFMNVNEQCCVLCEMESQNKENKG